jgi:hypothetical protein
MIAITKNDGECRQAGIFFGIRSRRLMSEGEGRKVGPDKKKGKMVQSGAVICK